jgi:hypothetical protein
MPTKINNESPLELTANQKEQGLATLGGVAKGASIGAKLGTLIPIPGIGTAAGAGIGAVIGGIGNFLKTKNQQEQEQPAQLPQPMYTTNINAMGEEIPNKMMYRPFKALSPYTASYSAYNMSAKQANSEEKMKQISGADSALQANAFYAALNDAKEKGADTFKVGDKTFNVK